MIERLNLPGAPEPRGPYSHVVKANGFVFLSGQACIDPSTDEFSFGDIEHETRLTLKNIQRLLEGSGASLAHVVKCSVFLVDPGEFSRMNAVYEEFFGKGKPARTTVAVAFAEPRMRVEIDCIAYVGVD